MNAVPRLLSLVAPMRGVLALCILMRVLNQSLGVALLMVAVGGVMQMVEAGRVTGRVWPLAGWLVGLGLVKGLCRYFEQFSGHYVAFRLLSSMRTRLFDKLEELAPAGLGRDRSGDLLTRAVSDIERIEVFYAHTIAPAFVAIVVPALAVIALAVLDLRLAMGLLPCLLVVGIAIPWLTKRLTERAAARARNGVGDLGDVFTDGILGLRDVLALDAGQLRIAEIGRAGTSLLRAQRGLARCGALQNGLTDLVIGAATLGAAAASLALTRMGELSPFQLPVALTLVMAAFVPVLGVSSFLPDFEQALESGRRFFSILDRPSPVATAVEESAPAFTEEGIRFESVSFDYPDGTRAVRALSLHISPGEVVAFAGESGAGKSTLVDLLLRFREPTAGIIRLDGRDIRSLSTAALRARFTVVSQRSHIFQTTIRKNLLLANPDATPGQLQRALVLAGLEATVAALPDGLDTEVGSLGGRLSGGQRQRLAMARAFLREAPILIFDEATSHLDAYHEREAQRAIRAWMREEDGSARTALVISHRLNSVRAADRALVFKSGHLIEAGAPDELEAGGRAYRRLFGITDPALAEAGE